MLSISIITHVGDGPNDWTVVGHCLSSSKEVLTGLMLLQGSYGRVEPIQVWEKIEDLPQDLQDKISERRSAEREKELTALLDLARQLAEATEKMKGLTPNERKAIQEILEPPYVDDIPF